MFTTQNSWIGHTRLLQRIFNYVDFNKTADLFMYCKP